MLGDFIIWKCDMCHHEWQAHKDDEQACNWCGGTSSPLPSQSSIDFIIVHPGKMHTDDALCVGLASYVTNVGIVERREPTEEELDDPRVLILDVGGRHEPKLNNFDHHQLPEDNLDCAFVLYCQHKGLDKLFLDHTNWYETTSFIDTQGPDKTAEALGLPRWPKGLVSPILTGLLGVMEKFNNEVLPRQYVMILTQIVGNLIEYAEDKKASVERIKELAVHVCINNVAGLFYDYNKSTGLQDYKDKLLEEHNLKVGFVIMRDDRGPGWTLYRFNDDKRIDFAKLDGHKDIHFAHTNGFTAKTKPDITVDEALELVKLALVEKKDS